MINITIFPSSLLLRDLCGLCVNRNDGLVHAETAEFAEGRG